MNDYFSPSDPDAGFLITRATSRGSPPPIPAHLDRQHEAHRRLARLRRRLAHLGVDLGFQGEQPGAGGPRRPPARRYRHLLTFFGTSYPLIASRRTAMAQTLGVGRAVVHRALEAPKPEVSCLGATGLILKPKLNLIGKGGILRIFQNGH
jgi:hypothetical protein